MKKFRAWHIALIGLAVFLLFGGISAIIIRTNEKYHSQSAWTVGWDNGRWWTFGDAESYSIDEADSVQISSSIKAVELSCISADINITQTDGDEMQVHLYGDYASVGGEIELDIQSVGSTIKVIVKYPRNTGTYSNDLVLDIQLPQQYNQDIKISSVSSDIEFEGETMMLDTFEVKTVSGAINFNTLYAKSVRVETVSGDVMLTTMVNPDLTVETVSGDVQIVLEGDKEFYVDYSTISGDFECDIPLNIKSQTRGGFEGYSGNENAVRFEVGTISGDFVIIEK